MLNNFEEQTFRRRVDQCLSHVSLILNGAKTGHIFTPDAVPHQYEDKYLLGNYITNSGSICQLNCLKVLGLDSNKLSELKEWSSVNDVSLKFESVHTCAFVKEATREEESPKVVVETTGGMFGASKYTSKVVTKITEYFYKFKVNYKIVAVRGVGANPEDVIQLQRREAEQEIVLLSKSPPYPERNTFEHFVNISWLLRNLSVTEPNAAMSFEINRSDDKCFTPRRNKDIAAAEKFFSEFNLFAKEIGVHFQNHLFDVQHRHSKNRVDTAAIYNAHSFVPVVPLFGDVEYQRDAAAENSAATDVVVSSVDWDKKVLLSASTVNDLLFEHDRSLRAKCAEMETLLPYTAQSATAIITATEAKLLVIFTHVNDVCRHFFDSINYIEDLIHKQLVSAVGKELQPSDFNAYMRFHNRKLLREEYQPAPFVHSVRRSPAHSPEGTLRIEDTLSGGSAAAVPEPIYTLVSSTEAGRAAQMEFTLNASTRVRFGGDRHLHAWLSHSFTGQQQPDLKLVAQARQFSSFIVLIGRIASATLFEPKYGFIVQNKDEVIIPLLLETLPTPKQFRDAIESLSPEQQRFAKAFRSMQLESTLFGVCVVQIKPQLEKVLNLAPDSLTKEIQLTQDLMKLFIEYQIPTDLMSFDGAASATAANRLTAVKGHVKAMNDMLAAAKAGEIKDRANELAYLHGPKRTSSGSSHSEYCDEEDDGGSYAEEECCDRMMECELSAAPAFQKKSMVMRRSLFGMAAPAPAPKARTFTSTSTLEKRGVQKESAAPSMSAVVKNLSVGSKKKMDLNSNSAPATTHVVVNKPSTTSNNKAEQDEGEQVEQNAENAGVVAVDFTKFPTLLDRNYEKFDTDSALRPTIVNVGTTWTKKAQAALLAKETVSALGADEQTKEKTAAFDLLDALSRSGALTVDDASLHVVIAATHSFDKSLMDTVVQGNVNPIERVERSTLIMASTIHSLSAAEIVVDNQLTRLSESTPALFLSAAEDETAGEQGQLEDGSA